MSQSSSDKYLYFTVALLKDSFTLDALWQDAVKHHMIDQPGQLIALRLTEYYEMMTQGVVQPVVRVPAIMATPETEGVQSREEKPSASGVAPTPVVPPSPAPASQPPATPSPAPQPAANNSFINQITGRMRALRRDNDGIIFASPSVDQNADEAADYWAPM